MDPDFTRLLNAMETGDEEARGRVVAGVYGLFHQCAERLMRKERPDHTLQATVLCHDALMELVAAKGRRWKGRGAFLAAAAKVMRHGLLDHARAKVALKRGGGWQRQPFEILIEAYSPDPLTLEDAADLAEMLGRHASLYPAEAEAVDMRYFLGLSAREIAEHLEISVSSVERACRSAQTWLEMKLASPD